MATLKPGVTGRRAAPPARGKAGRRKKRNNSKRPPHEAAQTISIPEAGRKYFGLGKNASYEAAERGEIPFILVGKKRKRVPVRAMERKLDAVS
jgi:hypothetical protein